MTNFSQILKLQLETLLLFVIANLNRRIAEKNIQNVIRKYVAQNKKLGAISGVDFYFEKTV